ncbi:MAG TPA: phosphoglycerate mutase family protein [Thermomicrobiales bacterium]|nr:phosphoglycerate mutase family protein [Thermomicrobiales bacterium]
MRTIEVRRHSQRVRPGQHLSQWGVTLARRVGAELGPFDRVVTSPLPRCVETAVAMGFAVDVARAQLAGDDGQGETFPGAAEVDWAAGYAGFARLLGRNSALADFCGAQAEIWRSIARALPDGGRALIVGHGGAFLTGAAIVCRPRADHAAWGAGNGYCEGVRLRFDGDACTQVEILRVEQRA